MSFQTLIGTALAVVSFALVILSRVQLGKSFAMTPQAKDLVTHGLYSRLRNPMYVFADLTLIGFALMLHRWEPILLLLILVPLQIRNARNERRLLQTKFGERYEAYLQHTWF